MQEFSKYSTPFVPHSGAWPERDILELDDGYQTGVFRHRASSAGDLPPVLYLHGIQSHPGWFFASAAALAENGHEVFQVTRRGSGANQCDRGHARSVGQLFKDLSAAVRYVLDKTGSKKLALASVSWGGKLAAAFCSSSGNAADISSLTLVAPGIVSRVDVSSAIKLKIAACLFTRPKAKFAIPLNDPELFTDNPEMQEFLRSDPLALRRATARFMYVSRRLDRLVRRAGKGAVDMPVTLILSREDRIINSDSVRRVVMRLTEQRAEVVSLDGRHTLEFQKDPAEFHQVLLRACAK